MDSTIWAAIIGIGGVAIGSLLTYFLAGQKRRKEEEAKVSVEQTQYALEAYRKFAALLKPISEHASPESKIVIKKDGQAYINAPVARKFYEDIRDFVYSEYGIYLSQNLRQRVIPESRDYILKLIDNSTPDDDGWVPIGNNKAKKAQNALNWIRHTVLKESGTSNLETPGKIIK